MAGSANWKCADCDINNGPEATACVICGSTRRAPMPRPAAPSRPAAKRPSPARPTGDWQCTVCRATNGARNLSCVGCGKSWKTSGGPAPKKTTTGPARPKPDAAKKTATAKAAPPKAASSGTASGPGPAKKAAPRKTATPRTGTGGGAGGRPTGVFYPPTGGTGYTPAPPRTTTPPPYIPPGRTPPGYAPPARPPGPYPKPAKKSRGCLFGCLGVVVGLMLLGGVQSLVTGALDSAGPDDAKPSAKPGGTGAACPSRIASALPGGGGATLVDAFRTDEHRITLCRTKTGKIYYYGEFRDGRETGIAMPAKKTDDGYEANNRPYRYVISGDTVSIYKSGSRIGREVLTPEPSPS
ncbi:MULTISPECIES: zinc finger Ran-binding domain-containing protein [unclassified Streptomyces]|uniref:zinc finger Ran-binding domain-containing protein n=1 Tax=unclassified Streptomyces TaxID=2593676 RepID=UPI0006AEE461|nr:MULTISPECIES: zinc finger Ran-binding domain-containing protein [unclassified Streptomyces]KOX31601.1 hypothetical protein ADL06_10825 [Streptomyces sp. NRRL F-6491]KOX48061.1 hypothetical protein ADL08_11405 [Streptomyces sp. NRRL F-6492]